MAGPTEIPETYRLMSHTVRLDLFEERKEKCKFRFTVENFKLCDFHKVDGVSTDLMSPYYIAGGSGLQESKWLIKVKFLNDPKTKTVTDVDCSIYQEWKPPGYKCDARCTFYFVSTTGELKLLEENKRCSCETLLKESESLLPNGTLTIECHLLITHPAAVRQRAMTSSGWTEPRHLQNLKSDLRGLHENLQHSDVVLRCGDEDIKAHKCILSARSSVFAKMFEHEMRENLENVVVITDVSAETIKAMLRHIYCGEIGELTTEMHLQLYSVASKYDLKDLKSISSKFVASHLTVDTISEAAILAHLHDDQELLEASKTFFPSHISDLVSSPDWGNLILKYEVLAKELINKAVFYN